MKIHVFTTDENQNIKEWRAQARQAKLRRVCNFLVWISCVVPLLTALTSLIHRYNRWNTIRHCNRLLKRQKSRKN